MSAQTMRDLAHEAFHRKMESEGVCIEYVNPPIPTRGHDFVAYFDPEGLCGYGASAEDAYLHLMEMVDA